MDTLWERVREGRNSALIGIAKAPPPPADVTVIRVNCDVPPRPLGPVLEAQDKISAVLGNAAPLWDQAADRVFQGLRRRILGDYGQPQPAAALVAAVNRLAQKSLRPTALLFEAVDAADADTLRLLATVLSRGGWLQAPLVLAFRSASASPEAQGLLDALRLRDGDAAVLYPPPPLSAAGPPQPGPAASGPLLDVAAVLEGLPAEVLRVLRAGALVGSGFEVELVGRLLGVDEVRALEWLQVARDSGVPLEDHGEGRFHLTEPVLQALRGSLLPSLAAAWHRRLASLLSAAPGGRPAVAAGEAERVATRPLPRPVAEEREPVTIAADQQGAAPSASAEEPPLFDGHLDQAAEAASVRLQGAAQLEWPYPDVFAPGRAGSAEPPAEAAPAAEAAPEPEPAAASAAPAPAAASAATPAPAAPAPAAEDDDAQEGSDTDARAAGHYVAAGDLDAGVERFLRAARQAERVGASSQAAAYAVQALQLVDSLPENSQRRRMRIRALCELARQQWHGAGEGFSLTDALKSAQAARLLLQPGDPARVWFDVAPLLAGIYYDLGDLTSLERALEELTTASRHLQESGDSYAAARLLNDLAAVHIRVGDPVQAAHLLGESRKIFERHAGQDRVATRELAETHHLLARLPLHVAARPGREADAVSLGREHGRTAEALYHELNDPREVARVWETLARLDHQGGRRGAALGLLQAALSKQEEVGDVLGLARSTATLADTLAEDGRIAEALELLDASIALNFEKGSPLGLAFNRRALERLAAAAQQRGLLPALHAASERLRRAEDVLGPTRLPAT